MMPSRPLSKNKLIIQKHCNVNEASMDMWPFWAFEENISILNEMAEDEEKQRKSEQEKSQASMPNFNPSSYMRDFNNMSNKFK